MADNLKLTHNVYEEFSILGADDKWVNPRQDGTGGTPVERYSRVIDELRSQDKEVIVPVRRDDGGLPERIFVSVHLWRESPDVLESIGKREGIIYRANGTVTSKYLQELSEQEALEVRV